MIYIQHESSTLLNMDSVVMAASKNSIASEKEAELLQRRLEYFEACVKHMGEDLKTYLSRQSGEDHQHICKLLRTVASFETKNQEMQNAFYVCAQKYENIHKEKIVYEKCKKYTLESLKTAKEKMIDPLKGVFDELAATNKGILKDQNANKRADRIKEDIRSHTLKAIPIYGALFEKHRVHRLKKIIECLVMSELRYHCRAVEELSGVLGYLALIDSDADKKEDSQSERYGASSGSGKLAKDTSNSS